MAPNKKASYYVIQVIGDDGEVVGFKCKLCSMKSAFKTSVLRHMKHRHGPDQQQQLKESPIKAAAKAVPIPKIPEKLLEPIAAMEEHLEAVAEAEVDASGKKKRSIIPQFIGNILNADQDIVAYECKLCRMQSAFKTSVYRHVKSVHKDLDEKDLDNLDRASPDEIVIHDMMEDNNGTITPTSERRKSSRKHIDEVVNDENLIVAYKCKICGMQSTFMSSVYRHVKRTHQNDQEEPVEDDEEEMDFDLSQDEEGLFMVESELEENALKKFIGKVTNPDDNTDTYQCILCSMTSTQYKSIHRHIIIKHTKRNSFDCEFCGETLPNSYDLSNHMTRCHKALLDPADRLDNNDIKAYGENPDEEIEDELVEDETTPAAVASVPSTIKAASNKKNTTTSTTNQKNEPIAEDDNEDAE